MIEPDLALAICRAYGLTFRTLGMIQQSKGLLVAKIPGLSNMKELYRCYQKFGKEIWAAANEFAADTISLPDPNQGHYSTSKTRLPRPQANALHLVASFPQADKIKQLSDVGALLALWIIEDMAYWVTEDFEQYHEDPENAQYAKIWAAVPEEETMHAEAGWDESLVKKLNALLE